MAPNRLHVDSRSWSRLVEYLNQYPRTEKFMLGIGVLDASATTAWLFVLPKQLEDRASLCRIDPADVGTVFQRLGERFVKRGSWIRTSSSRCCRSKEPGG